MREYLLIAGAAFLIGLCVGFNIADILWRWAGKGR